MSKAFRIDQSADVSVRILGINAIDLGIAEECDVVCNPPVYRVRCSTDIKHLKTLVGEHPPIVVQEKGTPRCSLLWEFAQPLYPDLTIEVESRRSVPGYTVETPGTIQEEIDRYFITGAYLWQVTHEAGEEHIFVHFRAPGKT